MAKSRGLYVDLRAYLLWNWSAHVTFDLFTDAAEVALELGRPWVELAAWIATQRAALKLPPLNAPLGASP